jgi:MFS superfamily sulfate permease-like transporter
MGAEKVDRYSLPLLRGVLPLDTSKLTGDILAGVTLAALGIPEVMGYTKIAGTPIVTGLYTLLLPVIAFALLGAPATWSSLRTQQRQLFSHQSSSALRPLGPRTTSAQPALWPW